jgi:hypothetical protein
VKTVRALAIAHASDSLCIWTHYFDAEVVLENRNMATHVDSTPTRSEFRGREIDIHRYSYLGSLTSAKFIGGTAPQANWMSRASLLTVLDALGMTVIVGRDDRDHPSGPAILLYAAHIPDFSETGYLQRYPDVAAAVEQKQLSSGAEHYIRYGRTEGRLTR